MNNYGKVRRIWREEFIDKLLFIEKAQEKFIKALDPKVRIGMLSELKESLELTDRELTFRLQEPFSTFMRVSFAYKRNWAHQNRSIVAYQR